MRLFVAIELSGEVKARFTAYQKQLMRFSRDVRWTKPEQMHVTLKFLGDVPEARAAEVCEAAAHIAEATTLFQVRAGACGCFPPRGRVRIVHVPMTAEGGPLEKLSRRCEDVYAGLGFAREHRPFTGHVTIGRVREDQSNGRLRQAVEAMAAEDVVQAVSGLSVFESVLSPGGAQYTRIAEGTFSEASGG